MSGNHNGSLEGALEIVSAAADAGADAIKLQTYTAETMTLDIKDGEFYISDEQSLHEPIVRRANELGLLCFSSAFDETAVDFLEELEVPAYKIASFEIVHLPLIRKIAATGKPVVMSTGMATLAEIDEAVTAARDAGCENLILLKCTSTYPATPENSNVLTIPHLREMFNCEIGLSDHTMGVGCSVAAVAHGATVIEKHFTLSRADGGVDSAFSLEPDELKTLVVETERAWQSLGKVAYGPRDAEKGSLVFRRSVYIAEDMHAGDILTSENMRIIRPGYGLAPKHYNDLLGKRLAQAAKRGTPLSWDLIGE
jgi:N-acetylneuraminate synthase